MPAYSFPLPAELLHETSTGIAPASERTLRVAAATLANARPQQVSATRVVGVLGPDDLDAFNSLVSQLAIDYDFVASVRAGDGTFAVRFSRPSYDNE